MSVDNPVVYITQEGPHNFTIAEKYGQLEFLSYGELTPSRSPRNAQIISDIRKGLETYRPGVDYILLTGSPVAIAYAVAVAAKKQKAAEHNLLKYDAQFRDYLLYRVEM